MSIGLDKPRSRHSGGRGLGCIQVGFACALLAAGGVGGYVGLSAHTTPEQLAEEERSKAQAPGELSDQANRLINELWKMEDLERAPRR